MDTVNFELGSIRNCMTQSGAITVTLRFQKNSKKQQQHIANFILGIHVTHDCTMSTACTY